MIKKSRLDLYLLNKGLCETRQKAQGLILAGKVRDIHGKVWDKPGQQVTIGSEFFIDYQFKLYNQNRIIALYLKDVLAIEHICLAIIFLCNIFLSY